MSTNEAPTTEAVTDPEPVIDTTEAPQAVTDPAEAPEDKQPEGKGNKEAAKYRVQLRETEAARDVLTAIVEAMRTAEVNRIVETSDARIKPDALWASGVNLADLLTEDGAIDADLVNAAIGTAAEKFGVRIPKAPSVAGQGNVGGDVHSADKADTFESAFAPRH